MGDPSPKTVRVRLATNFGQRVQAETTSARLASRAGRSAAGTSGLSTPVSPKSDGSRTAGAVAAGTVWPSRRGRAGAAAGLGRLDGPGTCDRGRRPRDAVEPGASQGVEPLADLSADVVVVHDGSLVVAIDSGGAGLGRGQEVRSQSGDQRPSHPPRDEPGAAIVGDVGPGPLDHHQQPVAESDQEEDMDEEPHQPGQVARELPSTELGNGRASADGGEHPLVAITEGTPGLSPQGAPGVVGRDRPHLHGGRGDARHELPAVLKMSEVADDVDFGAAGDRQVRLDQDTPRAIQRHAQRPRQRRRRDARRPEHGLCGDPLGRRPSPRRRRWP